MSSTRPIALVSAVTINGQTTYKPVVPTPYAPQTVGYKQKDDTRTSFLQKIPEGDTSTYTLLDIPLRGAISYLYHTMCYFYVILLIIFIICMLLQSNALEMSISQVVTWVVILNLIGCFIFGLFCGILQDAKPIAGRQTELNYIQRRRFRNGIRGSCLFALSSLSVVMTTIVLYVNQAVPDSSISADAFGLYASTAFTSAMVGFEACAYLSALPILCSIGFEIYWLSCRYYHGDRTASTDYASVRSRD